MKQNIRLFVDSDLSSGKEIIISSKDCHYLTNVMRAKVGNQVFLVNGRDGEFESEITEIKKKRVILKAKTQIKKLEKFPFLGLIFVPIQKIDVLAKTATELGVTNFYPISSDYMSAKKFNSERMIANIKEAVEQCERTDFPKVEKIQKLKDFLKNPDEKSVVLFCEERIKNRKAFDVLSDLRKQKKLSNNSKIYALVGPEGGFSKSEKEYIKSFSNVYPINLGKTVLRTETAVAGVLSLVSYFRY